MPLLPPLNVHKLPWMDTIHPIVVHFVIAMVPVAFGFDLIGYRGRGSALFVVSFWNLLFATVAIFVVILLGQVVADLAIRCSAALACSRIRSSPNRRRGCRWCAGCCPIPPWRGWLTARRAGGWPAPCGRIRRAG